MVQINRNPKMANLTPKTVAQTKMQEEEAEKAKTKKTSVNANELLKEVSNNNSNPPTPIFKNYKTWEEWVTAKGPVQRARDKALAEYNNALLNDASAADLRRLHDIYVKAQNDLDKWLNDNPRP